MALPEQQTVGDMWSWRSQGRLLAGVTRSFATVLLVSAAAVGLNSQPARAAEVEWLDVSKRDHSYWISFDALVDAPAQKVYGLLSDYAHLDNLSSVIVAIRVEPIPQGAGQRVRSILRSCFLVFCKQIVEVEDVTEANEQTIAAEIVPGEGDFESGHSRWRIQALGARTRLHYEATRTPSFWIPPLLGPWMIKATMRKHLETSVARLERVVSQGAER